MIKKTFYILLITCLVISNLFIPKAQAKTLGDLKKELAKFEEDYNNNKLEQQLNEKEQNQVKANITAINNSIYQAGVDIEKLNNQIADLNEQIIAKEKEIASILAFVQVSNGESAYLEYAFGAQDFTDFIYRIAVSEQLTAYNKKLVDSFNDNIRENKKKTEELATKKVQLAEKQNKLKGELNKIQVSLQNLEDFALTIEEQIGARKSEIKIYTNKGCKDNEDIDTCGQALLPPDTTFWRPTKRSSITSWFGPRDCSESGVSCYHYGVDMSTSGANLGSIPIYSVANGIVVYVVELDYNSNTGRYNTKCGGRKVYIQHNVNGRIYTTGYLHLRQINVKEGQTVTKDTQIGVMGGYPNANYEYWDNCSTGSHLHLEISTGTFNAGTYYSYRSSATNYINMPYSWTDRITRY
ncbi:MAG: peptidoglycan DD-metalloendopeptidase family protein [Bacilli bacterium]